MNLQAYIDRWTPVSDDEAENATYVDALTEAYRTFAGWNLDLNRLLIGLRLARVRARQHPSVENLARCDILHELIEEQQEGGTECT